MRQNGALRLSNKPNFIAPKSCEIEELLVEVEFQLIPTKKKPRSAVKLSLKNRPVKDRATSLINNLLTANIFFILLVFGWLLVALGGEALHVNLGWQIWQSLWMPVFQPAISILIAGAIGQWAIGKLFKK